MGQHLNNSVSLFAISRKKVTAKTVMKPRMVRSGGFGITIREL